MRTKKSEAHDTDSTIQEATGDTIMYVNEQ